MQIFSRTLRTENGKARGTTIGKSPRAENATCGANCWGALWQGGVAELAPANQKLSTFVAWPIRLRFSCAVATLFHMHSTVSLSRILPISHGDHVALMAWLQSAFTNYFLLP